MCHPTCAYARRPRTAARARQALEGIAWQFAQGGVSPPIEMIRAYEQKIKDEERRKVDKLKSKHRLTKIRRMRKIGYRASNNKNEKHINKDEILLQAVQNKKCGHQDLHALFTAIAEAKCSVCGDGKVGWNEECDEGSQRNANA